MYYRSAEKKRKRIRNSILGAFALIFSTVVTVFVLSQMNSTASFTTKAEAEIVKTTNISKSSSIDSSSSESSTTEETTEEVVSEEVAEVSPEAEAVYLETAEYGYAQETVAATVDYSNTNAAVVPTGALANGNTAGAVGSEAAAQMAAATGVDQATWEYIIARESNGDPSAANASGASGLFQTMPGWGSTATVQDQINAAINAYNAQGMSAWGY